MNVGPRSHGGHRHQRGFTLVELLVTAMISLLIMGGLTGIIQTTVRSKAIVQERIDITRQAGFAMERMVRAVSHSRQLLLPLADNMATDWPEHIREQTVPASPPIGSSLLATAVLALTLPAYSDLDFDGFPDADNDRDGRIDEDAGGDRHNDSAAGVYQIDDNGNGIIDEPFVFLFDDDDESPLVVNEDLLNGIDDDGDGSIDEDPAADANGDGCAGGCGIDDDADGSIDEGSSNDDDEDGASDEDWYDAVVFYLDNGVLKERTPVPWDENGASGVDGRDSVTSDIANLVTRLRFERLPGSGERQLVDITLGLTAANGQTVSLNRRVRVGGAL